MADLICQSQESLKHTITVKQYTQSDDLCRQFNPNQLYHDHNYLYHYHDHRDLLYHDPHPEPVAVHALGHIATTEHTKGARRRERDERGKGDFEKIMIVP